MELLWGVDLLSLLLVNWKTFGASMAILWSKPSSSRFSFVLAENSYILLTFGPNLSAQEFSLISHSSDPPWRLRALTSSDISLFLPPLGEALATCQSISFSLSFSS